MFMIDPEILFFINILENIWDIKKIEKKFVLNTSNNSFFLIKENDFLNLTPALFIRQFIIFFLFI